MTNHGPKLELVERLAPELGVSLGEAQLSKLSTLASELLSWTARVNLTAIREPRDVEISHILDSLTVVKTLQRVTQERGQIVDVGTGAGFPGLVLAISAPELHFTLVEATMKKIAFLHHVVKLMDLNNVEVAPGRAEDFAQSAAYRDRYDVAVARAVGSTATLVELLVPFLNQGGYALLMKTQQAIAAEITAAQHAIERLGAVLEGVIAVEGPEILRRRALVMVRKVAPTDPLYPRRAGVPQRRPLA